MKLIMSGSIHSMKPFAPGSPSTDVEIHLAVSGDEGTVRAQIILHVPKADAEKLLYGQTLHVVVATDP